jgi:DNA-binding CsgD family transcriptional regulator
MLAALKSAAVVVDGALRVLDSNAYATNAPDKRRTFDIMGEAEPKLRLRDPSQHARLKNIIESMEHSGETMDLMAMPFVFPGHRTIIHILGLPKEDVKTSDSVDVSPEPQYLLVWRLQSGLRRINITALKREFGLTQAEITTVEAIGRGLTLEDLAESRDISANTARNQLQNAMSKLGLKRQAEIAAFYAELTIFWPLVDAPCPESIPALTPIARSK